MKLTLSEQAICALIAGEMSLPIWREWSRKQGVPDFSDELINGFMKWLAGDTSSEGLNESARRFRHSLPNDLRELDKPAGAYAGYALSSVPMIALNQCEDVHEDIFSTGVFYMAAALCSIGIEAVWVDPERLTECEMKWIKMWWGRCCIRFPQLLQKT